MQKLIYFFLKKTILNWKRPVYSKGLYEFSKRYLDLWYGDNNFDQETNGEFRLLKSLARNNLLNVAFDIGANGGGYTNKILEFNPNATVHCFEPDPRAWLEVSKHVPNTPRIHKVNAAIGSNPGQAKFHLAKQSTHSSLVLSESNSLGDVTVPVTTIDAYISKNKIHYVNFVKMDIEGNEMPALEGARNSLGGVLSTLFNLNSLAHKS